MKYYDPDLPSFKWAINMSEMVQGEPSKALQGND